MEKRLKLARGLLKPNGVLIATIDENELNHLAVLLERSDLFGDAMRQTAGGAGGTQLLNAFADPTRLMLAAALRDDELCVCDLAWVTERADKLVSHHMRALRAAGLATSRRDGKMVVYGLTEEGASLLAATLSDAVVTA